MKIFDLLPPNLFSILVSKNKEIYTEALFVLRKAFKQEMSIKKTDLVSMLIASLEEAILEMDLAEEESAGEEGRADAEKAGATLSGRAHFLLRRLKETGWIEMEYQVESFEENITVPDYSIKIINLLHSLTDESVREYNSYVYSTYSALKTADQERDEFMYNALLTASENTVRLVDELKTLHNNIRKYHQALNEYATVNDILKGHFDGYKNLIMDKVYHPLKTLDSVPRFKEPIRKILNGWLLDHALRERIGEQALLRGKYKTKEEAAEDIILKIGEISDTYEKLDDMLGEIDRKNNAYTRASIEKLRYLLNTDRSIKGKIVELLTAAAAPGGETGPKMVEKLGEAAELYRQGYIDEKSLYVRAAKSKKEEGKPLEARMAENEAAEEDLAEFMERAKNIYSHSRVQKFIERIMAGLDVITAEEIPLSGDEDFILLMLAALKSGDKRTFYEVEFQEGYIKNNGYRIPNMYFYRKG